MAGKAIETGPPKCFLILFLDYLELAILRNDDAT